MAGALDPNSIKARLAVAARDSEALDTLVKELRISSYPMKPNRKLTLKTLTRRGLEEPEDEGYDELDALLNTYVKTRTPRKSNMIYLNNPQDTYSRPVLESHKYGWGTTLEKFGPLKAFTQPYRKQ